MPDAAERWADGKLGQMDIDAKVGQLLVFGFCGPVITPDVVEMIARYRVGGLRVSLKFRSMNLFHDVKPGTQPEEWTLRSLHVPEGNNRDFAFASPATHCTARQYAGVLNRLRQVAMDRPAGVPIHFTIDQEGSGSDDLLCGQRLFPQAMGIAAAGDEDLAYRVARATGEQARAVGVNMLHSPVLDVNTNPRNPEIGPRAYSDRAEEVIRHARKTMRGLADAGVIATGKHFPGRGESVSDAHWGLPTVDLDIGQLEAEHLLPYRALIAEGLPAVMVAHSVYPALGETDMPASCSERIVKGCLREQLGFKGVVTTDNMMMGGLLQKFELTDAVLRTIRAGCDLVLLRDESPVRIRVIERLREAVRVGELTERRIDESVMRILKMRHAMGLADGGGKVDLDAAAASVADPATAALATEAAERTVLLLRDEAGLLPLDPSRRVLLVEQVFPTHAMVNDFDCHPGLLWEEMCRLSDNVGSVEIANVPSADDCARVLRRLGEADTVVATNYYYHKAASSNTELIRRIIAAGKKVIAISNTPYAFGAPAELPTVVTIFNPGAREHCRAAVEVIYGRLTPTASLPVSL
jgi:beta-N-acetylhexosaminidase